jgi:hypothetical protein
METIKISINWWMNKTWDIYIMEHYSVKNRDEVMMYYRMEESWKHYSKEKESKHTRPQIMWLHLCEMSATGKTTQRKSRLMLSEAGKGKESDC